MMASEHFGQVIDPASESADSRKLARLIGGACLAIAAAVPASCSAPALAARSVAEGGLPPFRETLERLPLSHQRVENFHGTDAPPSSATLFAPRGAILVGSVFRQGRKPRLVGWGTGRGRGMDRAGNVAGPDGGALASLRRGAGA